MIRIRYSGCRDLEQIKTLKVKNGELEKASSYGHGVPSESSAREEGIFDDDARSRNPSRQRATKTEIKMKTEMKTRQKVAMKMKTKA